MSIFSAAWAKLFPLTRAEPLSYPAPQVAPPRLYVVKGPMAAQASQQEWDSTESAATAIAHSARRRALSPRQRLWSALAAHYAISAAIGALYGAAAEVMPEISRGSGALFGAGLWLAAQELAMPAIGWSRPLREYSAGMQANSLGEHLAYGATTELLRRVMREAR